MTTITSIAKTYTELGKHNGYFITTDNYRLKWATKWTFETIKKSPLFNLTIDRWIQSLANAQ